MCSGDGGICTRRQINRGVPSALGPTQHNGSALQGRGKILAPGSELDLADINNWEVTVILFKKEFFITNHLDI